MEQHKKLNMNKEKICRWWEYDDYYETECSNQMEVEDYDPIQPTYCPYCGGKIKIEQV